MATASAKAYRYLEEDLTCPVCLELFTDPVILPCSHTLCAKCIQGILENRNNFPQGFNCPCCRKSCHMNRQQALELPKNLLIENIISRYKETSSKPHIKTSGNADDDDEDYEDDDQENCYDLVCDICIDRIERPAKFLCKHCNLLYCKGCFKKWHPKIGVLAWHTVEPATAKKSMILCQNHSENNTIFCQSCDTLVCHLCICKDVGEHVSHEIINKQTAARQMKKKASDTNSEVVTWFDKLLEQRSSLSKMRSQVETKFKNIADESNNQRKLFTDDIISMLDEFMRIELKNFENKKTPLISKINSLQEENEQAKNTLASIKEMSEDLETTSDLEYLLNSVKDFGAMTKNFNECKQNVNESLTKINQLEIANDERRYVNELVTGLAEVVGDMMKVYGTAGADSELLPFSKLTDEYGRNSPFSFTNCHWYIKVEWSQRNNQGPDFFVGIGLSSMVYENEDSFICERFSYGILCDKDVLYFSRKGERKELCALISQPITVLLSVLVNSQRQYTVLGYNIFNSSDISVFKKSNVIFDKELADDARPVFNFSGGVKLLIANFFTAQSG